MLSILSIVHNSIRFLMASNAFGKIFRITTWGESHGKAIGVVIDGCPAGVPLTEEDLNQELARRAPGRSRLTSPRAEPDRAEIYSGVFEGKTTGTPISIVIPNRDADSQPYELTKDLLKPGHANFPYLQKYGVFDYRGGGRASARETACRVAAGAVAKKLLELYDILPLAYLKEVSSISADIDLEMLKRHPEQVRESALFCPDPVASEAMKKLIEEVRSQGDSVGGVVEVVVWNVPAGVGDPIYDKLDATLANALMSLPAAKGVEIGSGFHASQMLGSQHNDLYVKEAEAVRTLSNHSGGVLAGMSTGMPLQARVAFKPPSSIAVPQPTLTLGGAPATFQLPEGSRHDPCVAIRAVPVVEAMAALVVADALLLHRCARVFGAGSA